MLIGNVEINLFRRGGLIFEFILMKVPGPNHAFVVWLGLLGLELTLDIANDVIRKPLGEKG